MPLHNNMLARFLFMPLHYNMLAHFLFMHATPSHPCTFPIHATPSQWFKGPQTRLCLCLNTFNRSVLLHQLQVLVHHVFSRTAYIHRICPCIWWFPCQKYCICTIWLWPTLLGSAEPGAGTSYSNFIFSFMNFPFASWTGEQSYFLAFCKPCKAFCKPSKPCNPCSSYSDLTRLPTCCLYFCFNAFDRSIPYTRCRC